MPKIAAFSNWGLKFAAPILEEWRKDHEVAWKMGYDPELHYESDVCFVDVCDHNAVVASRFKFPGRLVVRCMDIECWVRQPRGITWENVDAVVFGAKHIMRLVESLLVEVKKIEIDGPTWAVKDADGNVISTVEVHHVPFGVDPAKWSFREREGTRMACVCFRWSAKGLPLVLQVMSKLPGWSLHVLGKPSTERWLNAYVDHMVEEMGLDVEFTDPVPNVDEWLEDKDAFILGSQKEAFCYALAEAAAKGLKPVMHNFYGARDIWPGSWLWNTVDEAVEIALGPWDSASYRALIEEKYSLDRMMEGLNRACGLDS